MNIVAIDDNATDLMALERSLATEGLKLSSYLDPLDFLMDNQVQEADCYVLDLDLPHINGVDLAAKIAEQHPDTPIVFVSGVAKTFGWGRSFRSGAAAVFEKPFCAEHLKGQVEALINYAQKLKSLRADLDQTKQIALKDSLTGVWNRYALENFSSSVMDSSSYVMYSGATAVAPLSVLFMDLDGLKEINGRLGHYVGDRLLQAFAELVGRQLHRSLDSLFRFGGDEFVAVLPSTDSVGAVKVAQRILNKTREAATPRCPMGVSIGVATVLEISEGQFETSLVGCIADSNRRLRQAKDNGRDQIVSVDIE